MTATIHSFPYRPKHADFAQAVGICIRQSFALPTERDDELLIIRAMAEMALRRVNGEPTGTISDTLRELRAG